MARYIDADKADVDRIGCFYGTECYLEDVQEWLNEQPTADVVPRDYVVKIFEEIQEEIVAALESNYRVRDELLAKKDIAYEMVACINGKINALRGIEGFIEELKEKYIPN